MGQSRADIICQWEKPQEISIYEMNELFRQGKTAAPRILIFTAALLLVVYYFLSAVLPEDFGASFAGLFILLFAGAVGLVCYAYVLFPLWARYSRCTYTITEKGINARRVSRPWRLRWDIMKGYFISPHEQISGIRVLSIRTASSVKQLYLPKSELAEEIVSLVAEKVPRLERIPDSLRRISLTKAQYVWLFVLTILCSLCAAYYIVSYHSGSAARFILFAIMLFGPGTLGLALLYGRRFLKNPYLVVWAITVNMATLALTSLLTILFFFYYFSKQIEEP